MSHEKFQTCINACYECATECKHCENACLNETDVSKMVRCIKLDGECATICLAAATLMSGGSGFSNDICRLCAEMCEACATECEKHSHMEHCKKCAEVCRSCARECKSMVM